MLEHLKLRLAAALGLALALLAAVPALADDVPVARGNE